jgi:NAD(P)-dependent dehydrogenase (short-subunit alcohol dehydrogenase family)
MFWYGGNVQMVAPDLTSWAIADFLDLDNRVALVTGGGQGVGRAAACRLSEAGAIVVIGDLDAERAAATAAELSKGGSTCVGLEMDVMSQESVKDVVRRVTEEVGVISVLVNNAGIFPATPFVNGMQEEFSKVIETNIMGVVYCSRAVAKRMVEAGTRGTIVNVSSTAAFMAAPGKSAYTTSKHAVTGLTKATALELAPYGIRVLAVAPTMVQTEGIAAQMAGKDPVMETAGAARRPLGRSCFPDDVARVILFCASEMSAMMTGSTLIVDGGLLIGLF